MTMGIILFWLQLIDRVLSIEFLLPYPLRVRYGDSLLNIREVTVGIGNSLDMVK